MATRIFAYLDELKGAPADGLANINKVPREQRFAFSTLEDLVKLVGKYQKIDDLILFTHGVMGGMMIDDHVYGLDDKIIADAFAKVSTKIDAIHFEGCWVGEAPVAMAVFGKLFDAKSVSGFTWTCNTSVATVTIPKGAQAKDLETMLAPYLRWVMPGTTSAPLMASAARGREITMQVPLLWYRYDLGSDASQAPYENENYKRLGRQTYRARDEASYRTVAADKAENNSSPVPPFENVTVTLP